MWYLRQLLPLTYRSHYTHDGIKMFSVWNMWMGKVYNHDSMAIVSEANNGVSEHGPT